MLCVSVVNFSLFLIWEQYLYNATGKEKPSVYLFPKICIFFVKVWQAFTGF